MSQNTNVLLAPVTYNRGDYTALQAHCLRILIAKIADLYYSFKLGYRRKTPRGLGPRLLNVAKKVRADIVLYDPDEQDVNEESDDQG